MTEPTHAMEHHLRLASNRAVQFALEDKQSGTFHFGWYSLQERCHGRLQSINSIKTDEGRARCLEEAAGLLLRAAVWLRRSE